MSQKEQFDQLVSKARNILITTHIHPDLDAVGSVLAVKYYLDKKFPNVRSQIMVTGEATIVWDYFDVNKLLNWTADIADEIANYDLVIFLDASELSRFSYKAHTIDLSTFTSICIDHHKDIPPEFTLNLSNTNSIANSHNIFELLYKSELELLDEQIVRALLLGIMGDSGTFRYITAESSPVLATTKILVDTDLVDLQELEIEMSNMNELEVSLISDFVKNTNYIEIPGVPAFSYSYLDMDALEKTQDQNLIKKAANSYMFMFVRRILKYNWGFVIYPHTRQEFGISFRSIRNQPDVQELAKRFSGGGHIYASGGQYQMKPNEQITADAVCQKIVAEIKSNPPKLIS